LTPVKERILVQLPFKYIAGHPALDLVNTVDWTSRGPEQERLADFDQLIHWAEGAGVVSSKAAGALRARAAQHPRQAEAAYAGALEAREALQRLLISIGRGRPDSDALEDFNRMLAKALEHMRLVPASGRRTWESPLQLGWGQEESALEAIIWPVLWSAASLIASQEASLIRVCGGPDCGWMYVDRSRNGLRRWCQMETCGTREKSRRRTARMRAPARRRRAR
jgi:predicted RNA-binding Zn ribbon-like protein